MKRALIVIAMAVALAGCLAMESPTAVQPSAPGFWFGVWHGFIFPVTFIFSVFTDDVAVYAVPNNGTWYDFGYFIGICFLGVGARSAKRR
ncbi:hypothetical protein LVY65_12425 [Sphingomonas sp. G124]|jgi:hypothetical protein|uniref:Lipoprotein n=1 Tax=Sphingomonas cremea TaxID=2904799 RepID=A0A9X1QPF6_9SPHN|nr:hypothetical protein [Sphingomonas cremea]MCF2515862.1 hypothetical protein [Sphingomonas cremea]